MNTAFLFSGQGSQYPGMGTELSQLSSQAKQIFEAASDILGFDLLKACSEYTAEQLAQTGVSQPAIMAVSLAAREAAIGGGFVQDAVAGHSLGEYAAMTASGMLSLEDGFRVIKARACAMQKCSENQDGAMFALIGVSPEQAAEICGSVDGYVVPVNFNSPVQTVIAGEREAAEQAAQKASALKKRAMRLNVSAAFHSKLMQPAADEFYDFLKTIKFNAPNTEFYSNLTGDKLTDFSDMPKYLASHLVSPVRFTDELNAMVRDGISRFVELGPGKVLTGLVRKTLADVSYMNIEDKKTLEKAMEQNA